MVTLTHEAKVRLVTLLAQFSGPSEAARVVSKEFGVTLDRRTAWKFDASKSRCTMGPKYRQLFRDLRERWLTDLAAIGISHQAHRLRLLDRLAAKLERDGDYLGALRAIEQAAKEAGGLFNNHRTTKVEASVSIVPQNLQEARSQLALRLASYVERCDALPAP